MPECSIIIPVYNNWRYTSHCLDSIFKHSGTGVPDFEIIIIDDDSEDRTGFKIKEYIQKYSVIKYFKNPINSGFAKSCNHGARVANGEYLVFLNNDTIVTDGWLGQLTGTIKKDHNISIVGAKCIYPDQTIQHAGVAFPEFFQYSLYHIYRDVPHFFPLSDYEKDYQCVTGACFIIRKKDFEILNGFCEDYRNGFEDVDLCLRLTQLGKRIVYQPECEIIHYESKSDGRFDNMSLNKTILMDRWETKIKPDEIEHFNNDIEHALKTGSLSKVEDFSDTFKYRSLKIIGNYSLLNSGGLNFGPGKPANKIMIATDHPRHGKYWLVAGQLFAKSAGTLRLKYMTSQEKYYSQQKSLIKKILPGQNIFHFTILTSYLTGELMLEFSAFRDEFNLHNLGLYTFNEHPRRDVPSVAVLCYIDSNPAFLQDFISSFNEAGVEKIHVSILFVSDNKEKLKKLTIPPPGRVKMTITESSVLDIPIVFNNFIESSKCRYGISVNDSVSLKAIDIERFVEMMETDPGIGLVYKSTPGYLPLNGDIFSPQKKINYITLRNLRDIPIAFRTAAWRDAGQFDPRFYYYYNLDLSVSVISSGNWTGRTLDGIRTRNFVNKAPYPASVKSALEEMREMFYAKHSVFLLKQWVLFAQTINKRIVKHSYINGQKVTNPHDTLLGSLKMHLNHFLKKKFAGK